MAEWDLSDLEAGLETMAHDAARDAASAWFSRSQELLYDAGDDHDYEVYPIAQAAQPPEWDDAAGGYVFVYPHAASIFFEEGTDEHEIEAQQADYLAFEWPDAPDEIQEQFAATFPTVFFKKVEVDGLPAIRYVANSRQAGLEALEGK
ncbi:MAG: hypothetical protein ABEI57_05585 [Halapricum sp.]